jgi:Flp pilus assembly protein TadB
MVGRRNGFFAAVNRWPEANPWKFSVLVGVLFFFVGWLSFHGLGNGVGAGLIWGVVFFAVTAANLRRRRTKTS